MNLYIEIELCIAQLGTQVRRLGTQVRGNILAVSISGAALPYSAVWYGLTGFTLNLVILLARTLCCFGKTFFNMQCKHAIVFFKTK